MSYGKTIDYLYSLQKHGIKLGLDNIRKILSLLGNPQDNFLSVHVAGTNGKGSTAAMTASILRAAGFKVGLFTSPHLVSFTERIRVDDKEISEYDVVALTDEIRETVSGIEGFSPTFFEVVTAMGFLYFRRNKVDWAVIETGMGGRLDATNVIIPEVSIITKIGYDHKEFLGSTLGEIAKEKAGIIKKGVPVVTSSQEPEAFDAIKKTAMDRASGLHLYGKDFSSEIEKGDMDGSVFDYRGNENFAGIGIRLPGAHQVLNASLTIKAIEVIAGKTELYASRFTDDVVRRGLENTRWPGRLEFISDKPPIMIDGAHNPSAAAALADSLRDVFLKRFRRLILVVGIMADKDIKGIIEPLLPLTSEVILVKPSYERAAATDVLASHTKSLGFSYKIAADVNAGISMARELRREGDLIVVTGSFYTIGEAKEALGEKGVLSRLRE